jgi:mannose-6-phosphate isomerase-like protein (cupin superfamily)
MCPVDAFELDDIARRRAESGRMYLQFLEVPALSCGLYALPAFSRDPQQPHREDEVYYVISGRATITVAGEDRPVGPGSIVYVGAEVEHRFHSIADDLTVLVFFSPAHEVAPPAQS